MKKTILHPVLSFFVLFLGMHFVFAQNNGPNALNEIRTGTVLSFQESNRDSLITWQEKVVIHLSDNVVSNKDAIFFKGYLLTGLNQIRLNMSNVLNVELIDQKGMVLKRQYHPIADGMVVGNMVLPKKIKDGKYFLRAYTRWMKNYDESSYALQPIFIGESMELASVGNEGKRELNISSEGGNLVNGLMNRVVLKIPAGSESGTALSGQIVDENGLVVGEITRYTSNLFTGGFIPESGKSYELKLSDDRMLTIPQAESEGFVLQVNNLDSQKAHVRVGTTGNFTGSTVKLLGSMNGVTYLEKYININETGQVDFEISKTGMPRGVMQLRLIGENKTELAQRPIWIDGNELNIDVRTMEGGSENELAVQITVTDQDNNPVQTELALGINQSKADQTTSVKEISNFNVNDLFVRGGINSVSDQDRRERFLRDLSLLASASEIEQLSINTDKDMDEILYPFQQGLELYGFAYDIENNILPNTDIQVMAFSEGDIWVQELKTDSKGQLFLNNIQFKGEANLVFRTTGEETQERLVKLVPARNKFENNSKSLEKVAKVKERKRVYEPTVVQVQDTTGLIVLEEVIIKEKSVKNRANPSLYNYDVEPTHVSIQNPERPRTIPQLLLNIPNIVVQGLGSPYPRVVNIRALAGAAGPILWVIDGFPLNQSVGGNGSLVEVMNMVPAVDVEKIEFLLGPEAAIFGSRSNGGVLLLTTRTGSNIDRTMRKDAQLVFQGYEANLNFDDYMQDKSRKAKKAFNTIYWNPQIQTDEEGQAIIRFAAPKDDNNIFIKATTITSDGRVGVYESLLQE